MYRIWWTLPNWERRVWLQMGERLCRGLSTYGPVERRGFTPAQWLTELEDELVDALHYLAFAREAVGKEAKDAGE